MVANASCREVRSVAELRELIDLSDERLVAILKHSTRCPVSRWAHAAFLGFAATAGERGLECAVLLVVEHRDVSRALADATGVEHQSPQVILLKERRAVWHASHGDVSEEALRAAEGAVGRP